MSTPFKMKGFSQHAGVSPMRKDKRKRTVEYTQDSDTGDITKKITKKSGATTTKTFKGGERRASKVIKDNKHRTRTVTGKGLDKEIHVQPKYTSGTYKSSQAYKTTPRENIKKTVKGVLDLGAGVGVAAITKGALPGATKKALLDASIHAGKGVSALTAGALTQQGVENVKEGVKNVKKNITNTVKKVKKNIRDKRQKKRESKLNK